jgi:polysaccharide chain length determinant protein (PEP-CTERM system associated)
MDAIRTLLFKHLYAAWRRRWMGVTIAWMVCGAGWVFVYTIPNQFESTARMFVDADAVLTPLLRGLAADLSPTSQLEILQRTLLSRPNMEKLVSKTDLELTPNSPSDRERLLTRLAAEVKVVPQTKNLFTITYRDKSARLARDVVKALLTIFVESATGGSRSDMDNARRFLEQQIQSYEQQLRGAERRRADFRARYAEVLPADDSPNVPALEAARSQVQTLDGKLEDAKIFRNAMKEEVEKTPSMLVVESGGSGGQYGFGSTPAKTQLQEAEEQLSLMLLKDTERHPDVVGQRKLIDSLKNSSLGGAVAGPAKNATSVRENRGDAPKRSVPNQVYDQLKIKLIESGTNITSLQRQHDDAVGYVDRLEKVQHEQPGLIAEYQNMDRVFAKTMKSFLPGCNPQTSLRRLICRPTR